MENDEKLKVLFLGNQGNQGYRYCKWLRNKGHKADLIFDFSTSHVRSLPEWEDPSLRNNYPDWITELPHKFWHYFRKSKTLDRKIRQYDLVMTCGNHIVVALNYDNPLVVKPVGGDITQVPFNAQNLRFELISYFFRRNSHKISAVLAVQEDVYWASKFLSVKAFYYNPIPVDIQAIQENVDQEYHESIKTIYGNHRLLIFHPTRKNLDSSRKDYKGNEIFLEGLKKFVIENEVKDGNQVKVVMGMHGNDVEKFKSTIDRLEFPDGLIDYIEHVPLPKLHAFMKLTNVVTVDQFGEVSRVSLGGISRESMSMGCPLISRTDVTDPVFVSAYAENAPMMPSFTANEISNHLTKVYQQLSTNKKALLSQRQEIMNWSLQNLHWDQVVDDLVKLLRKIKRDNP